MNELALVCGKTLVQQLPDETPDQLEEDTSAGSDVTPEQG